MATPQHESSPSHPFAERNILFLQQGLDVLAKISDADYVQRYPPEFASGIGDHVRHVIDHYTCFLGGLDVGQIDYDARDRDTRVETDRSAAADAIRAIIERLLSIPEDSGHRELEVSMDCGGELVDAGHCGRSTVGRELQFLVSHTVHHYALVGVMLRLAGHKPAEGFGIAPSTIRYVRARR